MRNRLSSPLARRAAFVAVAITAVLLPAHAAVGATLALDRTIQTSPFTETSVSMGDNEGSAFVPSDHSLWLADDIKKRIYEVDPATGALKRTIQQRAFINARKLGGGRRAGKERANDFEAIAYNRRKDVLFVFTGPCCKFLDARDGLPTDASVGAVQSRVVPASPHRRRLHSCRLEPHRRQDLGGEGRGDAIVPLRVRH
jgi:hypothetical protein